MGRFNSARILAIAFTSVASTVCTLGATHSGHAQSAETLVLSWDDCVQRARRDNPQIQASVASLESTREQETIARAGFLPQISASLGMTQAKGTSVATTGAAIAPIGTTYQGALSGSWNLFSGFQDFSRISQSQANTRAAEASFQQTLAQVSFDLRNAFESLHFAQRSIELTRGIIRRREENSAIVRLRFEAGRENRGSVLLSQAYVKQAHYDDLQARNAIDSSQALLKRVLGDSDLGSIQVKGDAPLRNPPKAPPAFDQLARLTPASLQTLAREEAAAAAVTESRSQFLPSLSANGSTGAQGPTFFPKNDRWSVGLTLSLQLFNGGRDLAGLKAAIQSRRAAELTWDNTLRAQSATLVQQYNAYKEAVIKLEMDEAFKSATELRAQIARNKYNQGLQTFDDWDLIENDLITRQKVYLQTRRDRGIAEASWEQAQGQSVLAEPQSSSKGNQP